MRFDRVIFRESAEAPTSNVRLAYIQSTEPNRRDSYVEVITCNQFGIMAANALYPWAMVRRAQVRTEPPAANTVVEHYIREMAAKRAGDMAEVEDHLAGIPWADESAPAEQPKRRGRPPKAKPQE